MPQFSNNHDFEKRLDIFLEIMGKMLHNVRKSRKESLEKVGKATKISPRIISRIEKGQYNPFVVNLIQLCNYYDISMASLLKDY